MSCPSPFIRDRVARTAARLILEPIFEADLESSAYGYRPKRSAGDAIQEVERRYRNGEYAVAWNNES